MKARFQLSILFVTLFTLMSNVACTKSSSSDDDSGGGTTAASVLSLADSTVTAGSTTNLVPTGGTPPYQFTLQSTIGGTVTGYTTYATLVAGSIAGMVGVTVTDSAGASALATITVTASSGSLVVSPLSTTVAPGGTVSYSVSGGTGVYTITATAGSFSGNVFTAPSTAQTVTITISDNGGHTVQATVYVQGSAASTASCGGTFALNLAGYPGTLYIVQDSTGHIAGYLSLTGYGYAAAISGSCSAGNISFTDLYSSSPYSGTYFVNPNTNKTVMTGTFSDSSGTYSWFAQ
jgi:plastocyanin